MNNKLSKVAEKMYQFMLGFKSVEKKTRLKCNIGVKTKQICLKSDSEKKSST